MTEKEKEIQKHMKQLGLTRAEAEQLYNEDNSDEVLPEVAEMEKRAKQLKRRYEGGTERKKPVREQKLDAIKVEIIQTIAKNLDQCSLTDFRDPQNITIKNPQREITFQVGGNNYSITLTKHKG